MATITSRHKMSNLPMNMYPSNHVTSSSALTDPIPKARYRCGSTDLALCSLFELLPIEMLDSVLINAFQPRTKARGQLMVPPKPSVDLSKTQ